MKPIRDIKTIAELEQGDWIAFAWRYNSTDKMEIMVTNITSCYDNNQRFLVHFLYGYKSCSEFINAKDVIAIGSTSGQDKIALWSSREKFVILQPNNEHLVAWQEEYKDRL